MFITLYSNIIDKCRVYNRCSCEECEPMPLVVESQCCQEIDQVKHEMDDAGVESCITDHPGFGPCCLNPYVLRSANYAFIDEHGHHGPPQTEQHKYVHTTVSQIYNSTAYGGW